MLILTFHAINSNITLDTENRIRIIELMNTSRKVLSGITAIIVTLAVLLFGVSISIINTLGSAQPVKDALASSGIYEEFVGEAVDDIPGPIETMIQFEPELRDVFVKAAIPSMKQDTEAGIDTLFAWLKDSSKEVAFNIEAAGAREDVSKAVGNYVQKMIEDMDECTSTPSRFNVNNPFIWSCKLPNTNVATYNQAFYEIVNGAEFWEDTNYTLNDILGISEQELKEDYQMFAAIYPSAVATAWISGIVIVLGAVAIWLLSRSVRRTLRPVGISFIVSGVLLIGLSIAAAVGMGIASEEFGGSDAIEKVSADLIAVLGGVMMGWLLWSGIVATVVGIAAIVVSFLVGKGATPTTPRVEPSVPEGTQPPTTM